MTEVTAQEFSRGVSAARRAASQGPVTITGRGEPCHVLLSIGDYRRLLTGERSVVDWVSADDDLDSEAGRVEVGFRPPEL